jgi:type I restriction enzyme S subunit
LVPCATVQEQLNAVGVLSALDERIALLRQSNITLEAIARALFKSWFVDFDPVRAKAEGREPDGMDAANAVLFPSGFRTSELGSNPVGWQSTTLAQFDDLTASTWTNRKHPRTLNYLELRGVTANRIAGMTEVAFSEAPSRARQHLRHGDTIVGTVRPGNQAFAYIDRPQDNLTGSTGFAVLSPRKAKYASFINLAATRGESIERLANLADGGAYPAVRPTVVAETPCIVPPDEVMVLFSALTRPLLERIAHNRRAASTISELRDTLLPRLFSGKLRLPDVGATIENAAA